jgi:hypothetical protein
MAVCNLFVIFQWRWAIMYGCVTCDIKNSYSMYMDILLLTFQHGNAWKLYRVCVDCTILIINNRNILGKLMLCKLLLRGIWLPVCGCLWTPLSQLLKIQTLLDLKISTADPLSFLGGWVSNCLHFFVWIYTVCPKSKCTDFSMDELATCHLVDVYQRVGSDLGCISILVSTG